MTSRAAERALWVASVVLVGIAVAGLRRSPGDETTPVVRPSTPPVRVAPPESLGVWARAVAAGNPFRFSHEPASVRYGATPVPSTEAERPPLPVFVLLGTIGGPPWQGIVSGFPQRSGNVVVRAGDEVEGFVVTRIVRDTVVIRGRDTVFTISARRQWQ